MHCLLIIAIHAVNATSHSKRAISGNVQSCIDSLNAVDTQLLISKSYVNITNYKRWNNHVNFICRSMPSLALLAISVLLILTLKKVPLKLSSNKLPHSVVPPSFPMKMLLLSSVLLLVLSLKLLVPLIPSLPKSPNCCSYSCH
jgi:hypothetical protein